MNGYCQFEINGEKVGLKFALPAIQQIFKRKAEVDIMYKLDGQDFYSPIGISRILYEGYKNNCLVKEYDPTYTFEDFCALVEDQLYVDKYEANILEALKVFEESRFVKKLVENTKPVEDEKKTKKKPKKSTGMK